MRVRGGARGYSELGGPTQAAGSGTQGERPRRADVGKHGSPGAPGSGARCPHSPEISAWGTSLRLKPLAP